MEDEIFGSEREGKFWCKSFPGWTLLCLENKHFTFSDGSAEGSRKATQQATKFSKMQDTLLNKGKQCNGLNKKKDFGVWFGWLGFYVFFLLLKL